MADRTDTDATIHGLFAHHAATRPDAVAVEHLGDEVTYGELRAAAERLAGLLVSRGVRPGSRVLVSAPRSPALVATLLGVLMAGGAYMAADHRWPPSRLRQAARHASTTLVVGTAAGSDLPGALHLPDSVAELCSEGAPLTSPPQVRGADPCCVIFTSGSTGEPKGVVTLHRPTVLRLHDVDFAPLDEDTVMLQSAPLPWDGLTLELWGPLLNGGRVVLHDGAPMTPRVLRRVRAQGVNTLFLTSTLLGGVVQDDIAALGGFRLLITGAERTSVHHVRAFLRAHPGRRLLHMYGPAEATVFATSFPLSLEALADLDDVPLGHGQACTTISVRDSSLEALPDGKIGEICIGGEALAAGYLSDPDLTRARFVRADGERIYRTGDLGWLDSEGRLRFVGREDRQVKLRGNRLELQEVEATMRREPAVRDAHAVVHTSETGVARLVGHYTTHDGRERTAAVRAQCVAGLPEYAVPVELRHHVRLPVLANGKADLHALAALVTESAPLDDDPLLSGLQRLVADVQGRVPTAADDLVDQGMDSLTAMRIAFRLSRDFGVAFEVSHLYALRSLAKVAASLPTLPRLPREETPTAALTPAHHDWWLREQLLPGDPAALVPSAFRVWGKPMTHTLLVAAVRDLADRHDLLRCRIEEGPEGPRLSLLPRGTVSPVLKDDEPVDPAAGLPERWLRPFDLAASPAWRVCLGHDPSGADVVALVFHHSLVDGWSESLLISELGQAWRAREAGYAPSWSRPAAAVGGSDGGWAPLAPEPEEHRFWGELLSGVQQLFLPQPSVPPDRGRDVGAWGLTGRASNEPGADGLSEIAERPAAEAVQARLLAAWGTALAAVPGCGTHVVGVAYAGRDRVSETAVGCHVELLPLPLAAATDTGRNAHVIARDWRAALGHRSASLPERLAGVPRDGRGRPLQAVFALQTTPWPRLDLGTGRDVKRIDLPTVAPLHPLALEAWLGEGGLVTVRLEWDRRLVCDEWAEAMRGHLAAALPRAGFAVTEGA